MKELLEFLEGEKYIIKQYKLIEGTKTKSRYDAIVEELDQTIDIIKYDKLKSIQELRGLLMNRIEILAFRYNSKQEYLIKVRVITLYEIILKIE